jgi:putative ABC transport system permease protein
MVYRVFARHIGLAFIFACPIAWYIMREWLGAFEYRIAMGAEIFMMAGALVVAIVTVTVSYHAVHAARFNPVEQLKNE